MEGMISERQDTAIFCPTCLKTRTCSHHNICAFETENEHKNTVITLIAIFTWKSTSCKADFL